MVVRLQNSNDATMCAIISSVHSGLDFAGLSSNLAYITSVFIGYIGTDLTGFAYQTLRCAGVEDGRNQ